MTQATKFIATAFAAMLLLAGLSACQKPEGPAERAGKSIDEATQKAGQEIEKAGQKIQDAAHEAKK
ncbi:hypothetical protein [Herminiimonas sp. CN]|uniref:hypothetical protein n=1 Tax=Herminiimonas sp. CN TaxID=1349818 RepID=UPI0004740916|nr:hypothetical protein [Herminiimonas sp. CN]